MSGLLIALCTVAVALVIFAVVVILVVLLRKPAPRRAPAPRKSAGEIKGELGERQIGALLNTCLLAGDTLFHNVILSSKRTGSSTEIDHILVSTRGVFVIETKNRSGDIYGGDDWEEWTQVLGRGDIRHPFYSPVKQNAGHVSFVRAVTGARTVEGAVVFLSGNLEHVKSSFVYTPAQLKTYLTLCPQTLSVRERDDAAERLKARIGENTVTAEEHAEYVRRHHGDQ